MNPSAARNVDHYQVAIIGFGPCGAVATALFGHHGIRTLAVDRAREVYDKPRAIALDHEILRLFDNLGVAERVLPHIMPFPVSQHFGADGTLIRRIGMVPPPYPLGYTPSMVFTQPSVEESLREHACSYSDVEVELGTELVRLDQTDQGVTLYLRGDDLAERTVTADYLVACDGAASTVRQLLGIRFDDLAFDEPWLVVDVLVHDQALGKLPATAAQFCDPARPTTFIIGPGNHRRWEIMLLPGEDPRAVEQPERVWQLLSRWLTPQDATLWRAASYRFHALIAAEWRRGSVFLAGDAAHQQPPFIGQGMCQGLRDVSNLAWKLDHVLSGRAAESLLDTYAEERADHVRELTTRIKAIGETICERDPVAARARDARLLAEGGGKARTITRQDIVPPLRRGFLAGQTHPARGTLFPQPRVVGATGPTLLDKVAGTGWRLVIDARRQCDLSALSEDRAKTLGINVLRIGAGCTDLPDAVGDGEVCMAELDGVVERWFESFNCCAALIRPDHYVFGTADDEKSVADLIGELEAGLSAGRR